MARDPTWMYRAVTCPDISLLLSFFSFRAEKLPETRTYLRSEGGKEGWTERCMNFMKIRDSWRTKISLCPTGHRSCFATLANMMRSDVKSGDLHWCSTGAGECVCIPNGTLFPI